LAASWLIAECARRLPSDQKQLNLFFMFFAFAVFTGLYLKFGFTPYYFIYGVFSACLIMSGIIDLKVHILPNIINAAGLAAAFIISVARGVNTPGPGPVWDFLSGGAACGVPMLLISVISKRGVGMGDVKFAALIGAFLGVLGGLCALWLSIVLGGVFSAVLIAAGKATRKSYIPFGPFMVIGALIMVFFGDFIKTFLSAAYHV